MSTKATDLLIGTFLLIFSMMYFVGGHKIVEQVNTWVAGEGVVLSADEQTDRDDDGNEYVRWICDISYTKADGSEWLKKNVDVYQRVSAGDTIDLIYDPDSKKMEPGGFPPIEDSKSLYGVAIFTGAISVCLLTHLMYLNVKDMITARKEKKK